MDLEQILQDVRIVGVLVGAVATLLFTRVYEAVVAVIHQRRRRRNLIRALFAEIDFNTRDLETFATKSAPAEDLRPHLTREPPVIPHIVSTEHTDFYRHHISDLHMFPNRLIADIVTFYGQLARLHAQTQAVRWDSFASLSVDGKVTTIEQIQMTARQSRDSGQRLLEDLKSRYPHLRLTRVVR